jgi:hypothetical protein
MRVPIRLLSVPVLVAIAGSLFAVSVASATEAEPLSIEKFTMQTVNQYDEPYTFTQAGGHPIGLATTIRFASEEIEDKGNHDRDLVPTRDPKDIVVSPPAGLLGNPNPKQFPQCPIRYVVEERHCPADTQVGTQRLLWFGGKQNLAPVVNLTPEKGQSAEFGLETGSAITVLLTAHVVRVPNRAGSSAPAYGLTLVSRDIPNARIELVEDEVLFWGVPADPIHDKMRGKHCELLSGEAGGVAQLRRLCEEDRTNEGSASDPSGVPPAPFLTLPTDCSAGPLTANVRADSWEEPGAVREGRYSGFQESTATLPPVTGCGLLQFEPKVQVAPDTSLADAPVGLGVNLQVPLDEDPETVATPQLRNAAVTLPAGLSINPGVVAGIAACNESGPEGINFEGPESEEENISGELQLAPGHCPDASTIGEAEAESPLQPEPLKGHVYLARPGCGAAGQHECTAQDAADGNLYQLYLELGGTGALGDTGVNLKVRLKTEANPATGQLTTVAEDNPEFPFSELRIRLNGGAQASLANPAACGPALTTTDLTPWSAPGHTPEGLLTAGTPDSSPFSSYLVTGCGSTVPFAPGFSSGTVTPNAGQFSSFTMNLSRQDREQYLKGVQIHIPPGLSGVLASVPLCEEPLAASGHCPESTRIGTTRVASGAGSNPFELEGVVYLTKGYGGAPFGLSIVTNAVAGPFNLGLVVVRARINVDPTDASLTVTTDETGPYAIPQILDGVPLRLKRITVNIDRPGFMFNPTSCNAQQVTGVISGSQNATATVASPFAVGGCQSLAFKPSFKVSTAGKTSKANGASLDVKLAYPKGSLGSEANIKSVKVDLPKQLPSRLTTLQKACTAQVFASNPSNCPAASIVGIVKANTPLLPVELSGPVYFVSHGGEAFPSLIVVLQGDGVRVDLTGATFISRQGITSSTFKTVPDVPVNTFELYLPEGKFSALAANGNLCTSKLVMPTEFTAQNGAVLKQSTKLTVTGCPKTKTAKKPKKKQGAKKDRGKAKKSSEGRA